jgi:hypothetical protein
MESLHIPYRLYSITIADLPEFSNGPYILSPIEPVRGDSEGYAPRYLRQCMLP